ncbi:hypothetical protein FSW04_01830 [Baekduia soli]|uniref:Uncharacterized protein n=1 Tax=Baekduia soli TaxID=496014 RepID=A0A5B8U0A7_9ACTN|nr:hypothetical protein [Baekduia soli]QEC46439.1 hypothetical protein FSW04_01830 [Baekduia soli]
MPLANGEPVTLVDVLEREHEQLDGIRIYQMHAVCERAYIRGECSEHTACSMAVAAASPPDRRGYLTLGISADDVAPLIGEVPFLLEATPPMRRTFGLNQIHVSPVVGWTESDQPA